MRVVEPIFFEPAPIRCLWDDLEKCRRCLRDPELRGVLNAGTYATFRVPGILPPGRKRATYVIVSLEPSGGATTRKKRREREKLGLRNLNGSPEDLSLQYAIEKWLLRRGEGYYLTDMAKCTMPVALAGPTRTARFDNCFDHLAAEIAVLRPQAIIAVGGATFRALHERRLPSWPAVFGVMHFSRQAAGHRRRLLRGRWRKEVPTVTELQGWAERRRVKGAHKKKPRAIRKGHLKLVGAYRAQFNAIRELIRIGRFAVEADARVDVSLSSLADNAPLPASVQRVLARLRSRRPRGISTKRKDK